MSDEKSDIERKITSDTRAEAERKWVEERPLPPFQNLVFEGGGVKGLVYVGGLRVLQASGDLQGVRRVGGSSAGGITAMLVGLGYSVDEIEAEMRALDFTKFQDAGETFWENVPEIGKLQKGIRKIEEFLRMATSERHGIYKGDVFLQWARAKIAEKLGDPDATFADLHKAMAVDPSLKDMMFTASNISSNGMPLQHFDFKNTPNVRIADAVRATMSFPGAFEAYDIDINGTRSTFVDGGLVNNFPIGYFDSLATKSSGEMNEEGFNITSLGLRVDDADEIAKYKWSLREYADKDISSIKGYLSGLASAKFSDRDQVYRRGFNTIQIPDQGVETLNFELTEAEKNALIEGGHKATSDYLRLYRQGALASHREYPNILEYYRTKNVDQLKEEQLVLMKEREQQTLRLKGRKSLSDDEHKQRQMVEWKLEIIGRILAVYEKTKEQQVVENASKMIDLQLSYADSTNEKLEKIVSEYKKEGAALNELLSKLDVSIAALEKAMQHKTARQCLEESFVRLQAFKEDLRDKTSEIQKQRVTASPIEKIKLETELNTFKVNRIEQLKAELSTELQRSEVLKELGEKGVKDLTELMLTEIERSVEPVAMAEGRPTNLQAYHGFLKESRRELNKKSNQIQVLGERFENRIKENNNRLKQLNREKAAYGESPGKMLEFSHRLGDFIKNQKSLAGKALRGLAILATGVVPALAYYGVKWLSGKIGGEEAKAKFEAFENTLRTDSENFVIEAEKLRDETRSILRQWKRADSLGTVERYETLLGKVQAREGSAFIPSWRTSAGKTQTEFLKVVAPELTRARATVTHAKELESEKAKKHKTSNEKPKTEKKEEMDRKKPKDDPPSP